MWPFKKRSKADAQPVDADNRIMPRGVLATVCPEGELVISLLAFALDRRNSVSEATVSFRSGVSVEFLAQDASVECWVYDEHGRSPKDGMADQPGNSATWRGAFRDLAVFRQGIVSRLKDRLIDPVVSSKAGLSGTLRFPRYDESGNVLEEDAVYRLAIEEAADSLLLRFTVEPRASKP